ncbi:glycosyltransferase 87 family protein [Streptomyces sp. OUCMDZ-4982]|uniref:glycosyltransferase family 87 protein n=1 Tax=Streptomyces sp. OUCMDZ-4982 TaxID=2973090 RepID=UPI00215BBE84|nr:glycosyltransferase 87 family protein [Streptomyces sp. OUCMDZ-4982]MCR8942404.1 glycosyltransferase 87 family protein [Streptomyces sp. OUCMDZ-4982]
MPSPSAEDTSVQQQERPVVRPTDQDEVAAAGSELFGGRVGRWARLGDGPLTPVRVVALTMIGMFALGMVQKIPCYEWAWFRGATSQYTHACYSDIPHLFLGRGFADGLIPYFDRLSGDMQYLEYPVLTGVFMQIASWLTLTPDSDPIQQREQMYWMVNAGMLMICAVIIAVCTVRTHRRRPWDGLLVALAPAFALTATINWDLLAVALTAAAMLMWSRGRVLAFGILIGLATAAKLYPVLLLGPLLVLCWRAGRWREYGTALLGAAAAWLAVNLPVMLYAPEGWRKFYTFSQERPIDFGSFWLIITQRTGKPIDIETVNTASVVLMVVFCAGIAGLALTAARRPRFAQLAFLVVAAFILTNKVYSPQYVLWLIPLAVLARPRWRDFLIWQACEIMYFLGIWFYLAYTSGGDKHQGLPQEGYQLAIALHLLGTLYLCALVVRDILRPEKDPVRRDGSDDPSGGVLDGAPDAFVLAPDARASGQHQARTVTETQVEWGVARER